MRLLLICDTHVPVRARTLPLQVWDEVDHADVVLHAGDWVDVELLGELDERAHKPAADGDCLRWRRGRGAG